MKKNKDLQKSEKTNSENSNLSQSSSTETEKESNSKKYGFSRRDFISRTAIGGVMAAGLLSLPESLTKGGKTSAQIAEEIIIERCVSRELAPYNGTDRANLAYKIRSNAAYYEFNMPIPCHPRNDDDENYQSRNYYGSFTKGLLRAPGAKDYFRGEADPEQYKLLLQALSTANPADFERITLGGEDPRLPPTIQSNSELDSEADSRLSLPTFAPVMQRRLETPQAGFNFDLEGKDYYQLINGSGNVSRTPVAFPSAVPFASKEEAAEIVENYWQAIVRDVAFINYDTDTFVSQAADDFNNTFLPYYKGPRDSSGRVSPGVFSRGILNGDLQGPFLSQFFLRDVPYGTQTIPARMRLPSATLKNDFLTRPDPWRTVQQGLFTGSQTTFDEKALRYIRSGRDIAEYVHNDAIYQTYLNAALLLVTTRERGGLEIPLDPNNPYRIDTGGYRKQSNFVEFGLSQLLTLIGEVSVRAHKAIWFQKWQVHRRLRPEEFGGRVHFNITDGADYQIDPLLYNSTSLGIIRSRYLDAKGNPYFFLPQAFPEGSPMHPSYGAGHATLAGACVTLLKAWFDSEVSFIRPNRRTGINPIYVPSADGSSRLDFTTTYDNQLNPITVRGELNKLASNVSIARNIAGVHWRSDYTQSIYLGEQVAIQLLEDYGYTYNEKFAGFSFLDFRNNWRTGIGANR